MQPWMPRAAFYLLFALGPSRLWSKQAGQLVHFKLAGGE